MSPRPRTTDDKAVITAAARLLAERGADALTFAEVSKRCGLAPPTLVQRFGSRAGLLAAVASGLASQVPEVFGRRPGGPALAALRQGLARCALLQAAALALAPGTDTSAFSAALRREIAHCLLLAIETRELPRVDVARLARTLQIVFAGAVATAALEQRAAVEEVDAAIVSQLAEYV